MSTRQKKAKSKNAQATESPSPSEEETRSPEFPDDPQPIILKNLSEDFLSPSNFAKEIRRIFPMINLKEAKPLRSGNGFIIFPASQADGAKLQKLPKDAFNHQFETKSLTARKKTTHDVVLKSIPLTLSEDEVLQALNNSGKCPTYLKRIISAVTKKETTLMRAGFEDENTAKDLIKYGFKIGFSSYRVEKAHTNPRIVQCYNCFSFGHERQNCKEQKKCIRCGSTSHISSSCKESKVSPKCANCGDSHVATYRGCPAYKSHQSMHRKATSGQTGTTTTQYPTFSAAVKSNLPSETIPKYNLTEIIVRISHILIRAINKSLQTSKSPTLSQEAIGDLINEIVSNGNLLDDLPPGEVLNPYVSNSHSQSASS